MKNYKAPEIMNSNMDGFEVINAMSGEDTFVCTNRFAPGRYYEWICSETCGYIEKEIYNGWEVKWCTKK